MEASFVWHNEAKKEWDDRANAWNENSTEMWDTGSRKDIIPFMQKYIKQGGHILDVGCGDGYGTLKLVNNGFKATGIDISREMIEKANTRITDENLQFMEADIVNLPFKDGEFDALMAINSLEWVESPVHALNELKRVLKTDGYFSVGILGPTAKPRVSSYKRLCGEDVICNTMMPWEFERLAKENGFKVIDGMGVYKREVTEAHLKGLPPELKQSLTFLWVFILQK